MRIMTIRRYASGLVSLAMLLVVLALVTTVGCYCPPTIPEEDPNTGQLAVRTDDPLSGQIVEDEDLPYDRPAALAAFEEMDLVEPNLAGYKFALVFLFQNQFDEDIAFDIYVNFQRVEPRRMVQAGRQVLIPILNDVVRASEDALRAIGAAEGNAALANIRDTEDIFGVPCPHLVEFRNFVTSDDHIIANQQLILTPLNHPPFDGTNLEPYTKDQPPLRLFPVYECPAIIAFVIEKTRIRGIELDREFSVPDYDADPQEPADPEELLYPHAISIQWLTDQVTVLTHFEKEFLLDAF